MISQGFKRNCNGEADRKRKGVEYVETNVLVAVGGQMI